MESDKERHIEKWKAIEWKFRVKYLNNRGRSMSDRGLSFRYVWTVIKLVYSSLSAKTRPPLGRGGQFTN